MAEAKYDLLLVRNDSNKKIYNQPWYKERLRTRYIKTRDPNTPSAFLHGKNWIFMKDGLDDFRDGLPPSPEDGIILQGHKGLSPNITGSSDDMSQVKQPAVRHRFNKEEICYARVTPLQQQRRDHIEEIEYGLTQHPLALYPHLEECLPPDVFEDVVDILDPEMNMGSEEGDEIYEEDDEDEPDSEPLPKPVPHPESRQDTYAEGEEGKVKNPYRWLPRKEEKDKRDKKRAAERRASSPSQDQHIKLVTKDFCDWVASLGGESNNIEESTITSLFASGYETKPALSVPIHVVELTNVPPELRMSAGIPPPTAQLQRGALKREEDIKEWEASGPYQPSWVKVKYGAWYLNPRTWKKRPANEPLADPKQLKENEMSQSKQKSKELDTELAPMHGAKAFMDFIDRKNTRRPEFLNNVADIQELQAREEQARLEAEQAKQRKTGKAASHKPLN